MAKIIVKTDNFAKRIIKNGERAKSKALFRMGGAARNGLRNQLQRFRGKGKRPTSAPGDAPYDHGTYRRTALFEVQPNRRGVSAGFADYKAKGYNGRRSKRLVLGNNLAQDTLEFGGNVTRSVIYRDKSKNAEKETFFIRPRPHVEPAQEELFKGTKKNSVYFRSQWQYLIDRGYLK